MDGPEVLSSAGSAAPHAREVTRLRDVSRAQWKSGLAAWLGWLFDGLDMHLYTLVALPFVAELLATQGTDPRVKEYGSWIQASFLVGWALGGGFFGRVGDRLGRTRALVLTILTYALFTGLSFFAQTWWHLFIFRFLAALGIGGEWAVGASLLSETWPRRWRPWMAAVLQTGGNLGILLACSAYWVVSHLALPNRGVFLVGVLPALMVLWIRRSVPESDEWHQATTQRAGRAPGVASLFRGGIRRTTLLAMAVCATALTGHWAFLFWSTQHLRSLLDREGWPASQVGAQVSEAFMLVIGVSIGGNFLAAALARRVGFRRAIALLCVAYFCCLTVCYGVPRDPDGLLYFLAAIGVCHGVFALFTMYLPPLFPTLLRTTGAGFCFNIGRIVAAFGTVFFGLFARVGDYRLALWYAAFLFIPAGAIALFLPENPAPQNPEAAAAC
ncbi:MAG TPA: MFS transporter [Phycisphaerae bacterium]|nr:MFS transporter [Phycisphaerae bacterium]HRY67751.1 MFS transporter [Phycisphaerae bacterium]HSA25203.1 MFS transporter [Phycisphaerae bacterium]